MFATRALFFNSFGGIVGNMLGRTIALSVFVAIVALAIFLLATQPAGVGPVGILFVFILIYVSVLGVLTFLLFGISKLIVKLSSSFTVKKPLRALTIRRAYYFSSVIGLAPVMLVGMQSVGEVGVYDLLLVVIFVVIACIYISKRTN
jgi:hypothetical protein